MTAVGPPSVEGVKVLNISSYTLNCDYCPGALTQARDENALGSASWQALKAAEKAGWRRFGEKDYCPACWGGRGAAEADTKAAIDCAGLGPEVEVIAYTQFSGVPDDLLPGHGVTNDDPVYRTWQTQDQGSDGARLIETAGRTCYDSFGKGRSSEAYHQHLLEVGHGSVLEHASISFFITNASRNLTHELVRHRVGVAYSQRSTRYVDESASPIAWHPLIASLPEAIRYNLGNWVGIAQRAYMTLVPELERALKAKGLSDTDARKQARGAARGVLPSALSTELVATFNLRALRHFIEMRASDAADAEIRLLAWRMYREAKVIVPEFFSDYEVAPAKDGIGCVVTTTYRKV